MVFKPERHKASVVAITIVEQRPVYDLPWQVHPPHQTRGSGCIVQDRLILTCAHLVAHAVEIAVHREGDRAEYHANVRHIDHDRDLALLVVDDSLFSHSTNAFELAPLPSVADELVVYRTEPRGARTTSLCTSVTDLVVKTYLHSQRELLVVECDSAFVPGDSGSPAFNDGGLVGIVHQEDSFGRSENSDLISSQVIRSFFEDINDGTIQGVPDLGIFCQKTHNHSLRTCFEISQLRGGILVTDVVYNSSSYGLMSRGDVILSIDNTPIDSDGYVSIADHQLHFSYLTSSHQVGESTSIEISRAGIRQFVDIILKSFVALVPPPRHGPTRYFFFAGFVFIQLTGDYLNKWKSYEIPFGYRFHYHCSLPSPERQEVVIIVKIYPHELTLGFCEMWGAIVSRIDGRNVSSLKDVVRCIENTTTTHVIEIENRGIRKDPIPYGYEYGDFITVPHQRGVMATKELMLKHEIPRDRSDDL